MSNTKTANNNDFNKLMDSYSNKDINKFSELIDQGVNINCINNDGKSFISSLLNGRHNSVMDEFLSILLKNNVSLKQIGIEKSLLTIVIQNHNNTSCLEKLLKNNINIDNFGIVKHRRSIGGGSYRDDPAIFHAIWQAVVKEDNRIVDLLLKYNVDLNIENQYDETPLHFLLRETSFYKKRKSATYLMEKLLKNGADPSILGPDGNTIIHYTASHFYGTDVLKILFTHNHNININAKNKHGDTALIKAVRNKNFKVARFLIRNGANSNVLSKMDSLLLWWRL